MTAPDVPALHGFVCAIASAPIAADAPVAQSAGIAVGGCGEGEDRCYAIALRHADGTRLVAYPSERQLDRLAAKLADLVEPHSAVVLAASAAPRLH